VVKVSGWPHPCQVKLVHIWDLELRLDQATIETRGYHRKTLAHQMSITNRLTTQDHGGGRA
jgi:hypothetical protein